MTESPRVVMHVTPSGCALPVRDSHGRLLLFKDTAHAEDFARGLVQGGVADAIVAALEDLDLPGPRTQPDDVAVMFEDGVTELSTEKQRDAARDLGAQVAASLLRLH